MASQLVGRCKCPECGFDAAHIKLSEKGTLYRYCPELSCGAQFFPRTVEAKERLKASARPTVSAPAPAPAPVTVPAPVQAPAPAPKPKAAPAPASAPPRTAPAKKAPMPPPPKPEPEPARSGLFGFKL